MAKIAREEYRQRKGSTVWHFMKNCQFWGTDYRRNEGDAITPMVCRFFRPTSGTLCDNCQNLEKKAAKK